MVRLVIRGNSCRRAGHEGFYLSEVSRSLVEDNSIQGSGLSVIEKVRPLAHSSGSASGLGGVQGTAGDAHGSDLQMAPRGTIFMRQMSSPILMLLSSSTSSSLAEAV